MAEIEGKLADAGYNTELTSDEEHGLWEIEIAYPNGQRLKIDWNLASYVEFQKAVELTRILEQRFPGPVRPRRERQERNDRLARGAARKGNGNGQKRT